MDYEEAMETRVSVGLALSELEQHGMGCRVLNGWIVGDDVQKDEPIAKITDGEVNGSAVLAWLGY